MNKFTKVFESDALVNYTVKTTLKLESGLIVEGSFDIQDKTLSLAKDQAAEIVKANKSVSFTKVEVEIKK
jgi:hypothetical protein